MAYTYYHWATRHVFSYLGSHDQFMVDNIVRCVSHTKQCTRGVKVTRHSSSHVHVFSDTLQEDELKSVTLFTKEHINMMKTRCTGRKITLADNKQPHAHTSPH